MSGHTVILHGDSQRRFAHGLIDKAPPGYVVKISEPKRTLEQNSKLWAMLTDLSVQKPEGICQTPDDWKAIVMNACGFECQFVHGLDGRPFPVGFRSSRLTKAQMSDMIEFIYEYGSRQGIVWSEPQEAEQ